MADTAWVIGSEVSESFMGLVAEASRLSAEQKLRLYAVLVSENLSDADTGLLLSCGANRVMQIPLSDADVNAEAAAVSCLENLAGEEGPVFVLFESSAFFCSVALSACIVLSVLRTFSSLSSRVLEYTFLAYYGPKFTH